VVSFTPRPLYPEERDSGTHWIGGKADSIVGLGEVEKRKKLQEHALSLFYFVQMYVKFTVPLCDLNC